MLTFLIVDPGLDGDVYADEPYLYGPLGSSANTIHVGDAQENLQGEGDLGLDIVEGGSSTGLAARKELGVPEGEAARKKWFISEDNRKQVGG